MDLCLKLPHDGRQGGHRLAIVSIKVLGDAFHERQANPLGHILVPAGPLTFQIVVHALKKLAMGLSVICQQCGKAGVAVIEQTPVIQGVLVSPCNLLSSGADWNSFHVETHQQGGGVTEMDRSSSWIDIIECIPYLT